MSALASEIGTGAVSPPAAETCIRTECPLKCSEKYNRVPSVTSERFEAPSLVICTDEITAGGASGDRSRNTLATTAATTAKPATIHRVTLVFAFVGARVPDNAPANSALIL